MQVHDLVARFASLAHSADAVKAEMESLRDDIDELNALLDYVAGVGGNMRQAFYRAPDLSLLKVRFAKGRRTPPHNHGTWATILLFSGSERNTLYRRDGSGKLVRERQVDLKPGDVIHIPADYAHVAECVSDEPAVGLHVYGANVLGVERQMWDPETMEEHQLDWTKYEPLALKASSMTGAP